MQMNLKTERYQEIWNIKKRLMEFQNIVAIFKIDYIDFYNGVFNKNFSKFGFGNRMGLRCKAMELKSLRCIVSRLERVVMVRPTYVLFSLETQSRKGHLNIYMTFVLYIYIYIYITCNDLYLRFII